MLLIVGVIWLKIIIKYLMMYMAFILGIVLFIVGITNLFSSLLLFVGGYLSLKNTLDYRLIKRNINKLKMDNGIKDVCDYTGIVDINMANSKELVSSVKPINHNADDIVGIKRIRRYGRVRKRY